MPIRATSNGVGVSESAASNVDAHSLHAIASHAQSYYQVEFYQLHVELYLDPCSYSYSKGSCVGLELLPVYCGTTCRLVYVYMYMYQVHVYIMHTSHHAYTYTYM